MLSPAALLLADGRFPTGSHAHSWGLEAAVNRGLINDLADVEGWIQGCLHTTWLLEAAAAAQARGLAVRRGDAVQWTALDGELGARMTSAPHRDVSRRLGRQMLRSGRAAWPDSASGGAMTATGSGPAAGHRQGPFAPLALGAVAAAAGLDGATTALVSLHHSVQGANSAAVRLLGLDPYALASGTARLGPTLADLADRALLSGEDPAGLPAGGAPMLDVLFADHHQATMRLFAS
ncbi:MAG: urease accessory protein UreF [Euzebya sp.]